jgi:hypothetical protein
MFNGAGSAPSLVRRRIGRDAVEEVRQLVFRRLWGNERVATPGSPIDEAPSRTFRRL